MKRIGYLYVLACIVLFAGLSCVNDGKVIEGNVGERASKSITVLGYGFERGANSSGTELAARQGAIVSLGEQVKGSRFDFRTRAGSIDFSVQSDVTIPGMREYYRRVDRSAGKYYAIFIMGAEIEVEYPRPYGVFAKSYSETGASIGTIVAGMKMRAVKESVSDKFSGTPPSDLTGRLFITDLKVTPDDSGQDVKVDCTISLVFDSVTR